MPKSRKEFKEEATSKIELRIRHLQEERDSRKAEYDSRIQALDEQIQMAELELEALKKLK